jgi:hypothetical protein
LTVFCAESANLTTEAATLAKAKAALPGFPERVLRVQPKQGRLFTECSDLETSERRPVGELPRRERRAGADPRRHLDAATAPEWVQLITPDLKNSQIVAFPFTGHSVLGKSTCAPSIMVALPRQPDEAVDQTCAAQTKLTFTGRDRSLHRNRRKHMPITAFNSFADGLETGNRQREHFIANINVEDGRHWIPMPTAYGSSPAASQRHVRGIQRRSEGLPGAKLGTHYHVGTVRGYTMGGHWRYLEHDGIARPGTFIYEPAGEAHYVGLSPTTRQHQR